MPYIELPGVTYGETIYVDPSLRPIICEKSRRTSFIHLHGQSLTINLPASAVKDVIETALQESSPEDVSPG